MFRRPTGFLSPPCKLQRASAVRNLCISCGQGDLLPLPADTTPCAHPASLKLKINRYALKTTQTLLPSTPLPASLSPRARDANPSGPESKTQTTASCVQLAPFARSRGPLPRPPPLAHAFWGGSGPTARKVPEGSSPCPRPRPQPASERDAPEGTPLPRRPPGARTPPSDPARPILPAPRASRQSCSLPFCHPPSGSWVLFSFLSEALTARTESGPGCGDRSPGPRALRAHPCARRAPSAPVPAAAAPGATAAPAPQPPRIPAPAATLTRSGPGEAEGRRCDSPTHRPGCSRRLCRRGRGGGRGGGSGSAFPPPSPLDSTDACRAPSPAPSSRLRPGR